MSCTVVYINCFIKSDRKQIVQNTTAEIILKCSNIRIKEHIEQTKIYAIRFRLLFVRTFNDQFSGDNG